MSNTDKQLTQEQLSEILDLHGKWLREEAGGVRADLSGADLSGAILSGADLSGAILSGADLSGAILSRADLSRAILSRADLSGAILSGADLSGAILSGANLSRADLSRAILSRADLSRADLSGADLSRADLSGAILSGANLTGASLPSPVLDLSNCKVGYKKVWNSDRSKLVVIELRFPAGSKLVSTVIGRKCRASEAVVVRCVTPGSERLRVFRSSYNGSFLYRVGETVKPTEPFDNSITEECTSGIHFFTTQEEAERYIG